MKTGTTKMVGTIGIIGAGNLGKALITCMQKNSIHVIASSRTPSIYNNLQITEDNKKLARESDIIILTVKPSTIGNVLEEIKENAKNKLIISFAAGLRLSYYESRLGPGAKIVRSMTNLALINNEGLTAYAFSRSCTHEDKETSITLLKSLGLSLEVQNEDHLDVITGVSGSGIAYIIRIMDIFENAAVARGLSVSDAKTIVRETMKGALSLTEESGSKNKDTIGKIASKGGTTEQGLNCLEQNHLEEILASAIEKTIDKCKIMGESHE